MFASGLKPLGGLIAFMGLAARIREAMGTMGNAEFARATGVKPASVTFWLDGSTKSLKAETAAQIERVTGYRANWIVTGKGPKRVDEQTQADDTWPFKNIEREKILALNPEQRARIEGRLEEMLSGMSTAPPKPQTVLLSGTKQVRKRKAA